MEDAMRGYRVPAFGSWNFSGGADQEEKARRGEDGFVQAHFFVRDGEELFKVLSSYNHQPQLWEKKRGDGEREWSTKKKKKKKKVDCYYDQEKKVWRKPIRAVDEDLYKIPPELLQIPKKRNLMKNCWSGFLCLSCIA